MGKRKVALYHAFHTSLPIMAGYGFLGLTYGIYMHELASTFCTLCCSPLPFMPAVQSSCWATCCWAASIPYKPSWWYWWWMHDICFMGSRCSKNIKDWDGRNSSLSSACRARPLPWLVLPRFRKEPTEDGTCSGLPGSMKPIRLLGQRWAASSVRFYPSTSKDSLAQVAAVAFTILIHVWKRNMMWSIAAGTLCYMLLIRILHF